jgi:hypothetical protein
LINYICRTARLLISNPNLHITSCRVMMLDSEKCILIVKWFV